MLTMMLGRIYTRDLVKTRMIKMTKFCACDDDEGAFINLKLRLVSIGK